MSARILLPRTIRLDASDGVVFSHAASAGEWAVVGTFLFWGRDPDSLGRKESIAFRSGFLGVDSFGHSTLVTVQPATPQERTQIVAQLAQQLVARLGAPSVAAAMPAAEEEVALAESLCQGQAENQLLALHRRFEDGAIREQFRSLTPREQTAFAGAGMHGHDRAFQFVEETSDNDPVDQIDLLALRGGMR